MSKTEVMTWEEVMTALTYNAVEVYTRLTVSKNSQVTVRTYKDSVVSHISAQPRTTTFSVVHNFEDAFSDRYWIVFN